MKGARLRGCEFARFADSDKTQKLLEPHCPPTIVRIYDALGNRYVEKRRK